MILKIHTKNKIIYISIYSVVTKNRNINKEKFLLINYGYKNTQGFYKEDV